ncbi:MAG: hypothetical protein P1U58_10940 [Verrucomicrobiales bacterium]|nr:hypothetical protein [Verrucomicrobiales bacterium]
MLIAIRSATFKIIGKMSGEEIRPARYPARNTEELSAVRCFVNLLDLDRVKPDVSALDKVPNHDGTITLVDNDQYPIGELKVQVKKIPKDALRFDCPAKLIAYSKVTTAPFLLVCVDVENQRAFWKQINPMMPEFRTSQKTFTVEFKVIENEIGKDTAYLDHWTRLCQNYQDRVSKIASFDPKAWGDPGLHKLSPEVVTSFQEYADELNTLLDIDFPIIRHEFFVDSWKLGVVIHKTGNESLSYSTYSIKYGESAPLISFSPDSLMNSEKLGDRPGNITETIISGEKAAAFQDRKKKGREFVFYYLEKLLDDKKLRVGGVNQSIELLMWFIREYGHTLGLVDAESYSSSDISYGVNVFFPAWYSITFGKVLVYFHHEYPDMLRSNPFPSFEQIANTGLRDVHPSADEVNHAIASGRSISAPWIRTHDFSLTALFEASRILADSGIETVTRRDRPWSRVSPRIENCFSPEDIAHNLALMIEGAAEDYADFIACNRFERLKCPLLQGDIALAFAADINDWDDGTPGVFFDEYRVQDRKGNLPKVQFINLANNSSGCVQERDELTIEGRAYRIDSHRTSHVPFLNGKRRIESLLYFWLREDLRRQYGDEFLRAGDIWSD